MSSDDDGTVLMAAFKKGAKPAPRQRNEQSFSPGQFFSEDSSSSEVPSTRARSQRPSQQPARRVAVAVRVSGRPPSNADEYVYYEAKPEVAGIIRENYQKGKIMYEVKLSTGETQHVSKLKSMHSAHLNYPRSCGDSMDTWDGQESFVTCCTSPFVHFFCFLFLTVPDR